MNPPGVLLDTGPLVALLSANDRNHDRARRLFAECAPPLRCCEAVVAEACFLMRKVHGVVRPKSSRSALGGSTRSRCRSRTTGTNIEALLKKYANRPISLADACLIRCAEVHDDARILTFDSDFRVYRWARNRRFDVP